MKHIVITIGCEYGSGGPEIGKAIAEALGIEFYDRDLVDKVVENLVERRRNNAPPKRVRTADGVHAGPRKSRIFQ